MEIKIKSKNLGDLVIKLISKQRAKELIVKIITQKNGMTDALGCIILEFSNREKKMKITV